MNRITLKDLGEMMENGRITPAAEYCPYCKKISYKSADDARQGGAELRQLGKGQTWVYECPKGKGFHLTSKKPIRGDDCPRQKKQSRSYRNRDYSIRRQRNYNK